MHWVASFGGHTEPTANKQTQRAGPSRRWPRPFLRPLPFYLHVRNHPRRSRPVGLTGSARRVELLSSMRFAISLLTVICIASVIGTVLKQHEPAVNYVNQFGPFGQSFLGLCSSMRCTARGGFADPGLLVVSTSLASPRNTPKFLSDIKSYKENVREQACARFLPKAKLPWQKARKPRPGALAACWPAGLEGAPAAA